MWGLETIRRMNAETGMRARARRANPFVLQDKEELDDMPPFPFPNLGDAVRDIDTDDRYVRVTSLFCDSTGMGATWEPALTTEQLVDELRRLYDEHGELILAIESEGQFQLHLAVWKWGR